MLNHYIQTPLRTFDGTRWGTGSKVILATKASKNSRAIVFVHGFRGHAINTWLQFPTLLAEAGCCAKDDMYFFGYEGRATAAQLSADLFASFLESLATNPFHDVINPSRPRNSAARDKAFSYRELIICAHSLGAVVTRRAVLDLALQPPAPNWLEKIKLIYFAPAHSGASILSLASLALTGIRFGPLFGGQVAEAAFRLAYPVLNDLDPIRQTIVQLRQDLLAAIGPNRDKARYLNARVLHSKSDRVVIHNALPGDYRAITTANCGHIGVCKPTSKNTAPLTFLLKYL